MALMRTKPVEDVLAQNRDEPGAEGAGGDGQGRLRKRLGPLDLMGFGIGIVIGTGIFTLTGVEAKLHAGPGRRRSRSSSPGVVSVLAALCYAELASAVPTAGSAYTYAYATLGESIAWIIGWDLILEFALGASVVARGWSGYLGDLLDLPTSFFGEKSVVNIGAVLIVLVLGVVAVVGIRESARVTNTLVLVKVSICVFVIVAGLFFVKGSNLTPFVPPAKAAAAGSGLTQPLSQGLSASRRRPSARRACSPRPPSCSSRTPASRRWRTSARRPVGPRATCRSASSARWRCRPCSTSASRSSWPA